jgi:ATP-binding cassette subfamily B protein/subfamily B ATP-binding cassette protein MsbA
MLKMLCPFSTGVNRFLLLNCLIGLLVMGLGFVQPLFYKLFIDEVILAKQFSLMPIVAAGYIAVFLFNLLFSYIKNYATNRWVNRVTFRAKMKILRGFFSRDFSEYDNQGVGDMKMRLEDDTACIANYAGTQTIGYSTAYVTMIISAILLFMIEWRLALFACVGIPLTFWFAHVIAKREAVVQNLQRENDQKMSSWLHASVQGWREIKALNLQRHEEKQFVRYIHRYAIFFGTWINYWVVRVLIVPKIKEEFLMRFCLYFFGGLLIISGRFDIGSLLVFMQYYALLSGALETVSTADAELLSSRLTSDRMLEELSRATEKTGGSDLPDGSGNISFRDVSFSYPGTEQAVLKRLTFDITKGERVAITGRSGAGKTTALKLMLGMLKPTAGDVLFSDLSISGIRPDALHRRFGFVMQENALVNASIRENLLYANPAATDNELELACEKAYISEFIAGLQEGMDTVIGERGIKLSGGQKQRIVLARQFLRNVDIFIFDEATSALDQYSENMIQDAVGSIGRDKTIIVVAHRKSSLALCDRVISL